MNKIVTVFLAGLVYTQAQLSVYSGPGKECIDELNLDQTEMYKLLHKKPLPVEDTLVKFWTCIWTKGKYLNEDSSLNVDNFEKFMIGIYTNVFSANPIDAERYAKESVACCKNKQDANLGTRIIQTMNCVQEWKPNRNTASKC